MYKDIVKLLNGFCRPELEEGYRPNDNKSLDEQLAGYYFREGQRLIVQDWINAHKNDSSEFIYTGVIITAHLISLIELPLATPKRENKRRFVEQSGRRSILNAFKVYLLNRENLKEN